MIRLIAAMDDHRGIAKKGQIPWHIHDDIVRFRKLTLQFGANILMGRRTYDAMTDYLKGRNNYIVSHTDLDLPAGINLVNDLDSFITNFKSDLWVIGGAQIFASTIKYADELYLTLIESDFNCDQFFPDYSGFKLKTNDGPHSENDLRFSYQLFTRL